MSGLPWKTLTQVSFSGKGFPSGSYLSVTRFPLICDPQRPTSQYSSDKHCATSHASQAVCLACLALLRLSNSLEQYLSSLPRLKTLRQHTACHPFAFAGRPLQSVKVSYSPPLDHSALSNSIRACLPPHLRFLPLDHSSISSPSSLPPPLDLPVDLLSVPPDFLLNSHLCPTPEALQPLNLATRQTQSSCVTFPFQALFSHLPLEISLSHP